jgi:hypothetical protein
MARRFQVTFDCWNVHMMAEWWAGRLGYDVEDHHEFVRTLIDGGRLTSDDIITVNGRLAFADVAAARDPDGAGPRLYFQSVQETKAAKNRLHLDVARGDGSLDDAIKEFVEAGATFTEYNSQGDHTWAVMADPEGNEFCIQ